MRCPRCNHNLRVRVELDAAWVCDACGWTGAGSDKHARSRQRSRSDYEVTFRQWVVCTILSLVFLIGPYATIGHWQPAWATPDFHAKHYWIFWPVYLAAAYVLSPLLNPSEGGWFDWSFFALDLSDGALSPFWILPSVALPIATALALLPANIVLHALWGISHYLFILLRRYA